MPIPDFKKIDNAFLYSDYSKYEYKFGDLDLMSSGGLLGNSVMNFGLFYYDIEDFIKAQDEARFLFNLRKNINFGGQNIFTKIPLTFSEEAWIYFNQLDPLPDLDVLIKIAEFIDGLVADGIYAKIDEMWYFAMNTESNALKGMKGYKSCFAVNSPTFTINRGFNGNGSNSYLDTNYNPSRDNINYALNSAHFGIYCRDNIASDNPHGIRTTTSNSISIVLHPKTSSTGNVSGRINHNGALFASTPNSFGHVLINRNTVDYPVTPNHLCKNGSVIVAPNGTPATGVPDGNLFLLGCNVITGTDIFNIQEIAFAHIGGGLTDEQIASMFARLETLLDYLGAGVV